MRRRRHPVEHPIISCTILEHSGASDKFGPLVSLTFLPQDGMTWTEARASIIQHGTKFVLKVETPMGLVTVPTVPSASESISQQPVLMASLGKGFDISRIPKGCSAWLERIK